MLLICYSEQALQKWKGKNWRWVYVALQLLNSSNINPKRSPHFNSGILRWRQNTTVPILLPCKGPSMEIIWRSPKCSYFLIVTKKIIYWKVGNIKTNKMSWMWASITWEWWPVKRRNFRIQKFVLLHDVLHFIFTYWENSICFSILYIWYDFLYFFWKEFIMISNFFKCHILKNTLYFTFE